MNERYDLDSYTPAHDARTYYTEQDYEERSLSRDRVKKSSPKKHKSRSKSNSPRYSRHFHDNGHHYDPQEYREEQNFGERDYGYRQHGSTHLTWRLDPEESLSDWTILVRTTEDTNSKGQARLNASGREEDSLISSEPGSLEEEESDDSFTVRYFYVHKTQLGVGPRRSEYFARLFRSRQSSRGFDVDSGVSRIELKKSAADAFPAMLDFVYSPPGVPVEVTTESAVALRHLATCFGIRQLFTDITAFIQEDLNVKSAATYLQEAFLYGHQKLQNAAAKICASHFASVKLSRLVALEPHLFHAIVTSQSFKCDSEIYCSRLCSYLRCKPQAISRSFLVPLTASSIMPQVSHLDALFLISILVSLGMVPGGRMVLEEDERRAPEGHDEFLEHDGPTLYHRCAEAAAKPVHQVVSNIGRMTRRRSSSQKKEEAGGQNQEFQYMKLPLEIRLDLVERALMTSKNPLVRDFDDASIRLTSTKSGEGDGDVKKLKKAYSKKIDKYKQKLHEMADEIQAYEYELSKFKRVPAEHRVAPLVSEYTFKEHPEFDQYGRSIYGENPPLALPRVGEPEVDGWIYPEERYTSDGHLDVRHWPMYYYKAN